jgi:hypothetical protein
MRTVALLAAILVLPCGLFADDTPISNLNIAIAPPTVSQPPESSLDGPSADGTVSSKYDTSVYHLKHVSARQVIPTLRRAICKSLTAEAAGKLPAHSVVSIVFMPTTSDDTLVAICPREHAELVKQAVETCDVAKQYAVKVQLFEVGSNGQTVPVGEPALVVGHEGSVECKGSGESPVTVSLQVTDAASLTAAPKESTEPGEERACSGPDCGQTEDAAAVTSSASPVSCSGLVAAGCVCPACSGTASVSGQCATCSGTCGTCEAEVASAKCKCGDSCKCAGTCKCGGKAVSQCEATESSSTQCAGTCENSSESCAHCPELTADEYRALVHILVHHWLQEHHEHVTGVAGTDTVPTESAETCPNTDESEKQESHTLPDLRALLSTEKLGVQLGCPAAPSTAEAAPATDQDACPCDPTTVPMVMGTPAEERLFLRRVHVCPGGTGCPETCDQDDEVAVTHVSDADSGESCPKDCGAPCQTPANEPPALVTLSPHKDGTASFGILISPQWQAELCKKYQGRRLSEIFEFHHGQDPAVVAFGLAVTPPSSLDATGANPQHPSVMVFDLLQEVYGGSNVLQEINQAGHAGYDEALAKSPRELPSVTPSKIETTVVTYPLRDLVLLDKSDHPVFDTCTIIDHIQSAVAPGSWAHPNVAIQLDQQSMSLVIRQTPEVHKQIEAHLHELRRSQVKRLCNLLERISAETEADED